MARVVLDNVTKSFAEVRAVRELSLEIGDGEFFSLLGQPSLIEVQAAHDESVAARRSEALKTKFRSDIEAVWKKP